MSLNEVQNVQAGYTAVRGVGTGSERLKSGILPVRDFNNWAKAALIQFANSLLHRSNMAVLDLSCGKGGDLKKYINLGQAISYYSGVDITLESLIEAVRRYNQSLEREAQRRNFRVFQADFVLADIGRIELQKHFQATKFDLISNMFALHYFFQSEVMARTFLRNVQLLMQPWGCFIAVFPNKDTIISRLRKLGYHGKSQGIPPAIENSIFKLQFVAPLDINERAFGQGYVFQLDEAVQNIQEYLIDMVDLKRLCGELGLTIKHEFPQLETLLTSREIPQKAKDSFSQWMNGTAKYLFLMKQKLSAGETMADPDFWANLDAEVPQEQQAQVQRIENIAQLGDVFLDVIGLYSAVVITHSNPHDVVSQPSIKQQGAAPRHLCDICNLSGEQIDYTALCERYKDEIWAPAILKQ